MNRSFVWTLLLAIILVSVIMMGCKKKAPEPEPVPPATETEFTGGKTTESEAAMTEQELRLKKLNEAKNVITTDNIYFDYDKATLTEESKKMLAKKAEYLLKNPDISISIEGHCDERGSNEYNLGLGERRAAAAKKYLVTYGVNASLIDSITYGEEKPTCFEHNESCWSKNRRAKFVVNE